MHAAVSSLALVLASAPSKAPFYIAGGLLVCWAVLLSAAGIRRPDAPGSKPVGRLLMGVSVVFVAATIATAVVTGSKPSGGGRAQASSSPNAPSGASSSDLELAAEPTGQLRYGTSRLTANAGKVTVHFTNKSPVAHNVTIERGATTIAATSTITGATATVTANLSPGTYTFFCSVDGHRQAGMHGTLTVR